MKHNTFFKALVLALLVAGGVTTMYGQHIVYEPYDFRQVNADGDTLYYRITSAVEPYTVAVTRCHDSIYHQLPHASYAWEVGQPGFAYPVYDYDSLINIPPAVTYDNVTYTVTAIDIEAFYYQQGLRVVNLPSTIETIDTAAFYLSSLTEITLQEGLRRINSSGLRWTSIREIDLPQSLLHIGTSAFSGCQQLQRITIPDNITMIPSGCFLSCISLDSVSLPDGIDTIEESAFCGTSALHTIVIPPHVQYIGFWTFTHENAIYPLGTMCFHLEGDNPPTLEGTAICYDTVVFYVPCGTLETYQSAWFPHVWANSVTFIEDCNGVFEQNELCIRIYPNPTADVLYFEGDFDSGCGVHIYDMAGKLVETAKLTSNMSELSISHLPEGYYVVKIEDGNGKTNSIKVCKLR